MILSSPVLMHDIVVIEHFCHKFIIILKDNLEIGFGGSGKYFFLNMIYYE